MEVVLPRTATRRDAHSSAVLLERVEPGATTAFAFRGTFMVPGMAVDDSELWPSPQYPAIPVLLEICQVCFSGRGHNRNPYEYILWLYQVKQRRWRQVARVSAHHPEEWIPVLLPVALRLVQPAIAPPEPDLHAAANRIIAVVEHELPELPDNLKRAHLLQLTHNYLCQRYADMESAPTLYQMPLKRDECFADVSLPAEPDAVGCSIQELEEVKQAKSPRRLPGRAGRNKPNNKAQQPPPAKAV